MSGTWSATWEIHRINITTQQPLQCRLMLFMQLLRLPSAHGKTCLKKLDLSNATSDCHLATSIPTTRQAGTTLQSSLHRILQRLFRGEIFHILLSSSKTHGCQDWPRPSREPASPSVSPVGVRVLGPSPVASQHGCLHCSPCAKVGARPRCPLHTPGSSSLQTPRPSCSWNLPRCPCSPAPVRSCDMLSERGRK